MKIIIHKVRLLTYVDPDVERGREEKNRGEGGCGKVDCVERRGGALVTQPGSPEFQFPGPHTLQLVLGLPEAPSHVSPGQSLGNSHKCHWRVQC